MVMMCVGNDDDVRAVACGADGALAGMAAGTILVDHTTASAHVAREVHAIAKKNARRFPRCPRLRRAGRRGEWQADDHGRRRPDAYSSGPSPYSRTYARAVTLLGGPGSGQLTKMVNQICIAGLVQALSEGINFAQRAGLDAERVLDVISKGAAQSWQMENRGKTMVGGQVRFRLCRGLDAQGPVDLPGGSSPQRRRAPGDRGGRSVLLAAAGGGWRTMGHFEPHSAAARRFVTVRPGRSALALLLLVASACGSALAGPLELRNAWMRPAHAGADLARAYVDIASDETLELTGASTPLAQRVEIVVAPISDPAAETVVAALPVSKGTTRLAYRGNHLRLIGIRWDAATGQQIPLTLRLRDAAGTEVLASTDILVRGILTPRQVPAAEQAEAERASGAAAPETPVKGADNAPAQDLPMAGPGTPMQPAQPPL